MAQPCSRAFFSLSVQFPTVACSILCACTDTWTITLALEKHSTFAVSFRMVAEQTFGKAQAQFLQQTVEQLTNTHTQAMNAMAEMVRALQIDVRASAESKFLVKDKESMTTKRAFTMLPHFSGKVEEYETWSFQLIQFLSQEPYFVEFLEWIENDLDSENQHSAGKEPRARRCCERRMCRSLKPTNATGKE